MEDNLTIILTKWALITQKMVTQTVDTPEGPMQVQQAVQVPIVFRNADEIKRYIDEKYNGEKPQIVLQKIQYSLEQENQIEFYYNEEDL